VTERALIDLWVARPESLQQDALLERFRSWLAPDERARLEAFRFEVHRHEYLVTRGLVRTALSSYRATAPEAWQFRKGAHDRPFIEPDRGIHFNLSNTPTLVVCAISETHEVGVDVEQLSEGPQILDVAETVFSTTELGELRALDRLGMLDRAVSLTRDYVTQRRQFGQPLAVFQGVQFQLTDAEVERAGAEELGKYALWSVQSGQASALGDALAFRLAAIEAAAVVFRTAHQLHGAIGFCDETVLSWVSRASAPLRRLPFGVSGTLAELSGRIGPVGLPGLFGGGTAP